MTTPPPLPTGQVKTIFHQAATASIFAPVLSIAINVLSSSGLNQLQGEAKLKMGMIVASFAGFIMILGLICGIIGLCGIPKHGTKGLLWKSVVGIIIPLGLVLLAVPAICHALALAKARRG
jgi:hypothetical protein